jgi:hypothetical protein
MVFIRLGAATGYGLFQGQFGHLRNLIENGSKGLFCTTPFYSDYCAFAGPFSPISYAPNPVFLPRLVSPPSAQRYGNKPLRVSNDGELR